MVLAKNWAPESPREKLENQFSGFLSLASNTTYTPNQLFDLLMPRLSGGAFKIVCFLIRKTLGWCDEHGNPVDEYPAPTYAEIIDGAGVSRNTVRSALEEAIQARAIKVIHQGSRKSVGSRGEAWRISLAYDDKSEAYVRNFEDFTGFFGGEGYFTHIPNQFFDCIIRTESIAVIKVVGAVIRYSIGFRAERGARRQVAQLSTARLEQITGLSRKAVQTALLRALERGYLIKVASAEGSLAASYCLRWASPPKMEERR